MTDQENVLPFVDDLSGTPVAWVCRVVEQFDRYGRGFELVHDKEKPLIEFYDARYPFTEYGQFVGRYYLDSLASNEDSGVGLLLDDRIPSWRISGASLRQCLIWARSILPGPMENELVRAVCNIEASHQAHVSRGTIGTVISQSKLGLTVEFDLGNGDSVVADVTRFAVERFPAKDKPGIRPGPKL